MKRWIVAAALVSACHREHAEEEEAPSGPVAVRCEAVRAGAFRETRALRGSLPGHSVGMTLI